MAALDHLIWSLRTFRKSVDTFRTCSELDLTISDNFDFSTIEAIFTNFISFIPVEINFLWTCSVQKNSDAYINVICVRKNFTDRWGMSLRNILSIITTFSYSCLKIIFLGGSNLTPPPRLHQRENLGSFPGVKENFRVFFFAQIGWFWEEFLGFGMVFENFGGLKWGLECFGFKIGFGEFWGLKQGSEFFGCILQ